MRYPKAVFVLTIVLLAGCNGSGGLGGKKICDKETITATGSGSPKATAKSQAKSAWESQAFGIAPAYGSWARANNKSLTCAHTSGSWPYRVFTCTARADPCRKE